MGTNNDHETVEEILQRKKASIRTPALPKGSPSWDDILDDTWADIRRKAKQRKPGYKTIQKLLSDSRFDK